MRFLFVTGNMYSGGAERAISVFSDALVRNGHEVGITVYRRTEKDYYINERVRVFELAGRQNKLLDVAGTIAQLRKISRQYAPDAILPFLSRAMRDVMLATLFQKNKVVSTLRIDPRNIGKREQGIFYRSFKASKAVFMQTQGQKDFYPKFIQDKTFIVPNAVGEQVLTQGESRRPAAEVRQLVSVGRLSAQKNFRMLIDAMAIVHKAHPAVTLKIFGDGPEKENLIAHIQALGLDHCVQLMGKTEDVAGELARADLFVFSSDFEGMPNALMEAMAAGLPCVSTDCPTGPKELIGKNERGLLVPVGQPEALAEAILYMVGHVPEANEMGQKAHAYMKDNYSPLEIARQLAENCQKYLHKR